MGIIGSLSGPSKECGRLAAGRPANCGPLAPRVEQDDSRSESTTLPVPGSLPCRDPSGRHTECACYFGLTKVPREQTQRLIVQGFFASVIERIPLASVRERLTDEIEKKTG